MWKDVVNLPDHIYVDGRVEQEAKALVKRLDPLIIDLTFDDLGLSPEELANLDEDVLYPAMQTAIDAAVGNDEELRNSLPPLATQFDKVVNGVKKLVAENNPGIDWPEDISGDVIYDD